MPEAEEDFFFIKKEPQNDKYNQQQLIEIEIDRPASSVPVAQDKSWIGQERMGSGLNQTINREELKFEK